MSIGKVVDRLNRTHRDLDPRIGDIAAWCYDCIEENGVYEELEHVAGLRVVCKNGQVQLPCNIYRLESVGSCNACDNITYSRSGDVLNLNDARPNFVFISATVIKTDEFGYHDIGPLLVDPCYWYCLFKLLEGPYFAGNIPADRYHEAEAKYYEAARAAKGSYRHVTADEIRALGLRLRSFVLPGQ